MVATPLDIEESAKIQQILADDYHQYETTAEKNKKLQIIAKLQQIIIDWIKECGRNDGCDEEIIQNSGGRLFTFGSYKQRVNGPTSDIDTLVVAPRHIDRLKHFFG